MPYYYGKSFIKALSWVSDAVAVSVKSKVIVPLSTIVTPFMAYNQFPSSSLTKITCASNPIGI